MAHEEQDISPSLIVDSGSPALLKFLDSFLQERNIKWLLAIGSLILFSSSIMLVANQWGDYTPFWQYLIMLGYTGLIYQISQWSYYRMGLRKTGAGLMALTTLLLPALLFALGWVQPVQLGDGVLRYLILLSLTGVFTSLAANRIFQHLLRGAAPTFFASYLLLALAYALLPLLPAVLLPWAMLILWLTFFGGTIKANRQVFWLTEQHQLPRIFGFFPIALLGGLFIGLFLLFGALLYSATGFFNQLCITIRRHHKFHGIFNQVGFFRRIEYTI